MKKVAKRRGAKNRKTLEFAMLKHHQVGKNYLKYLKFHFERVKDSRGMNFSHIMFMFFVYDLEFFSSAYVGEQFKINKESAINRYIKPLERAGYVGVYMNNGRASEEDKQMFGVESQTKKFTVTQAGRVFIQRMYRELEKRPEAAE
jgi:hypothetical protein